MEAQFKSKKEIYGNDHYLWIKRTPQAEFYGGYHYHDFFEATYYRACNKACTDKQLGKVTISGIDYALQNGSIVLIEPFAPHIVEMKEGVDYERFSLNFDLDFLMAACTSQSNIYSIFSRHNPSFPVFMASDDEGRDLLELTGRFANPKCKVGIDVYRKALIQEVLVCLYNICYNEAAERSTKGKNSWEIVSAIIKYVNEHIEENLSLDVFSALVNYSPYYVSRIFRKQTGITLSQYIINKRIDMAKTLLNVEDKPITEISKDIGFENYNHFYRTFLSNTGQSPSDYRKTIHKSITQS